MGEVHKSKFKPWTTYRYLPGQITKDSNNMDLKVYNTHRLRMFTAKPVVDTKPFKLDPTKWINRKKLRDELISALAIDQENKVLLERINVINRKGGYVNTYNPIAYTRFDKWKAQERKMKRIEHDNKKIYQDIVNSASHYQTKLFNNEWENKTLKHLTHSSTFPFMILKKNSMDTILYSQPSINDVQIKGNVPRPLCFLDFKVKNGEHLGRIIIELYQDFVPVTVQNFLSLCKGDTGLTYKNCIIHRIIKNQYMETGDITNGTGRGGFSVYGKNFREENHVLKHSKAGVLSMKRITPTDNNSQFCITFKRMESLDHKNVVFGKIIKGNDNLFKIHDYGRVIGKPYAEIIISNCGDINRNEFEICQKYTEYQNKNRASGCNETHRNSNVGNNIVCNDNVVNGGVGTRNVGSIDVKNCKCLPTC